MGVGSAFHTIYAVVPLFLKELGSPEVIATSSAGLFSIIIATPMLFIAALTRNVTNIVNYDPRVKANGVAVTEFESGLQIECTLTYLTYNISEQLRLRFDKANGLTS